MISLDIGAELRERRLPPAQLDALWREYEMRCWLRAVVSRGLKIENLDRMQRDLVRITLER